MRRGRAIRTGLFYLFVAAIAVELVFPLYYAAVTSLKSGAEVFRVDYWPRALSLDNYAAVLTEGAFPYNLLSSLIAATSVTLLALLLAVTAAYALSRVAFRGRGLLLMTILAVSMFPQIAVLAGLFELIRFLHLFNTIGALVFSYLIFTLPFTIWVLTAFMRDLPIEIEEAAIVDGASPWIIVTRIFVPLLGPALATTGLLAFIAAWNEFLFALTFTVSDRTRTVPVAIALLSGASEHEIPWGRIMAASVIVTAPLVALVLVFQRRIVTGLTAGGVKG